jgi:hypothetical protein
VDHTPLIQNYYHQKQKSQIAYPKMSGGFGYPGYSSNLDSISISNPAEIASTGFYGGSYYGVHSTSGMISRMTDHS